MAQNAFMIISGEKTGAIKGNAREGGNTDRITVIGFSHDLGDAPEGAKGKYKHRPLVIIKAIDPASPKLHQAQAVNDTLDCTLLCYRPAQGTSAGENHLKVVMSNAKIVSIRTIMENNRAQANAQLPIMEEVAFTYEGINWTYQSKDGSDTYGSAMSNPAPDQLEDWAKGVFVNAFKKQTDALVKELKVETKTLYQELLGEKKPAPPK